MRYLAVLLVLAGCDMARLPDREPLTGGNPAQGKALIAHFGCGSCHTIRGIANATGTVGPPLQDLKKRVYLGGVVSNGPEQLAKWIVNPRAYAANTAMPAVGVSEAQARDIAAYLYTQ
jgi:cytochrome c